MQLSFSFALQRYNRFFYLQWKEMIKVGESRFS